MLFTKLVASLAFVAPLVSGLTIETPSGWQSQTEVTINWDAVQGDPQVFSIELTNDAFNRQFALANNVPTGAMTLNVTLPVVPAGDGYTLQFVDISNLTDVFAETAPFAIAEEPETTSESGSASGTASGMSTVLTTAASTTAASTNQNTATSAAENTGTSTDSAAAGDSTSFDNGAVALGLSNINLAVMAVAAIAGARFVGF